MSIHPANYVTSPRELKAVNAQMGTAGGPDDPILNLPSFVDRTRKPTPARKSKEHGGCPRFDFEPVSLDFSTHFHSHIKPTTPRPTPSIPSTCPNPIRMRALTFRPSPPLGVCREPLSMASHVTWLPLFHQSSVKSHHSLTLLECALTQNAPITSLESALTKRRT